MENSNSNMISDKTLSGIVQNYLRAAVALKDMPFDYGSALCIDDEYVIAYRSGATSYTDYKNAFVTTYHSNVHIGDLSDLLDTFGFDPTFPQQACKKIVILEAVDHNGKTASERMRETA